MGYSLLYKISEKTAAAPSRISDFALDRSAFSFCRDERRRTRFLDVISRPLQRSENVIYRREIIDDFLANPGLLENAKTVFNRYDKLKEDWLELRGGIYENSSKSGVDPDVLLDCAYSSLKITSIFPKTIISFCRSISEMLGKYNITSSAFSEIKERCVQMLESESLNTIAEIASNFQYNSPADYDFELAVGYGDMLELAFCDITAVNEKPKKSLLHFPKKKDKNAQLSCEPPINDKVTADSKFILGEALYRIDFLLEQITSSVYATFYGISGELLFYECVIDYIDFLENRGYRAVYPKISDDSNTFLAHSLVDLLLICDTDSEIIANDVNIVGDQNGLIIFGGNDTGKTTYLRSIGTSQILFQAGMPIPALSAELSLRGGVYSHFSSSEEDFGRDDVSGRFEGEVRAVAELMRNVGKGSLVLFNETFQTTSYSEGRQAMSDILHALGRLGAQYVFVTHLSGVSDIMHDHKTELVRSDEAKRKYEIYTKEI